jgi:hypothetical protein
MVTPHFHKTMNPITGSSVKRSSNLPLTTSCTFVGGQSGHRCSRYTSLAILALWVSLAPGAARGHSSGDEDFAREDRENSVGLASDEPISDVVARFNKSVQSIAAKQKMPRPPSLTEIEVIGALRFNAHVNDGASRLARACRSAAASHRLPKGARLTMGSYSVGTAAEGTSKTERVFMWHIVLYFFVDEVPMSMSSSMINIRLQYIDTSD